MRGLMKLHNFLYNVYAQAEGPWYRIILTHDNDRHSFLAYQFAGPTYGGIVVSSPEIAELQEEGLIREAEELRKFFEGVFRCHRSSIMQATAATLELAKVYVDETE